MAANRLRRENAYSVGLRKEDIRTKRLTVCGFNCPLIIFTKSASFMVTVQSALSAGKGVQIYQLT